MLSTTTLRIHISFHFFHWLEAVIIPERMSPFPAVPWSTAKRLTRSVIVSGARLAQRRVHLQRQPVPARRGTRR